MKKFLGCILVLFLFAGNAYAEGNRLGAQFDTNGNIGVIYYGNDFGWAAGGSIGFKHENTEVDSLELEQDSDTTEFGVFVRKNFKVMDKTHIGLGVTASFAYWDQTLYRVVAPAEGKLGYATAINTEAESWSVAPYFLIDYHISKDFILNAGATIVKFKTIEYEWEGDDEFVTTDSTSYMEPFMSLTYLF